jgi:hypothetical protein
MLYVNLVQVSKKNKKQENFLFSTMLRLALGPNYLYIHWTKGSFPLDKNMRIEGNQSHPHKVDVSGQIYLLLDRSKWSVSCPQ